MSRHVGAADDAKVSYRLTSRYGACAEVQHVCALNLTHCKKNGARQVTERRSFVCFVWFFWAFFGLFFSKRVHAARAHCKYVHAVAVTERAAQRGCCPFFSFFELTWAQAQQFTAVGKMHSGGSGGGARRPAAAAAASGCGVGARHPEHHGNKPRLSEHKGRAEMCVSAQLSLTQMWRKREKRAEVMADCKRGGAVRTHSCM